MELRGQVLATLAQGVDGIASIHAKALVQWCCYCRHGLQPECWEGGSRGIPGTFWPASLVKKSEFQVH